MYDLISNVLLILFIDLQCMGIGDMYIHIQLRITQLTIAFSLVISCNTCMYNLVRKHPVCLVYMFVWYLLRPSTHISNSKTEELEF
jgi:hypothetical protein